MCVCAHLSECFLSICSTTVGVIPGATGTAEYPFECPWGTVRVPQSTALPIARPSSKQANNTTETKPHRDKQKHSKKTPTRPRAHARRTGPPPPPAAASSPPLQGQSQRCAMGGGKNTNMRTQTQRHQRARETAHRHTDTPQGTCEYRARLVPRKHPHKRTTKQAKKAETQTCPQRSR